MKIYYFNINKACNSNCIFCAADYEMMVQDAEQLKKHITVKEFCEMLTNASIGLGDRIIINGGEPTLHPDLIQILNCAKKTGAESYLFTNGRKLNNWQYALEVVRTGVDKITIPVYGDTADIHDSITRSRNSFQDTEKALENLKKLRMQYNFLLELKVLICMKNFKEIKRIADYLIREFKPDIFLVSGLIPSEVALKNMQVVPKKIHIEAVNDFFDFFWQISDKPFLILDGIPLCHLSDKNRIMYLLYRKLNMQERHENIIETLFWDVEGIYMNGHSDEIENWDKPVCMNKDCKYINACRLNTLINHSDWLREWIS